MGDSAAEDSDKPCDSVYPISHLRAIARTSSAGLAKHGVHRTMIAAWKRQAIDGMASAFSGAGDAAKAASESHSAAARLIHPRRPPPQTLDCSQPRRPRNSRLRRRFQYVRGPCSVPKRLAP